MAMLFIFGGLATFVIGGLTGVMVALVPFNFQAHDTYFIVAHLHSVLIGGSVFPMLAGFYYFFPMATGKKLAERPGRIAFWLIFTGFNVTFMPMHCHRPAGDAASRLHLSRRTGLRDAESRLDDRRDRFSPSGFLVFLVDVIRSMFRQEHSERNPWQRGHARVARRDAAEAVGRAVGARDRQPVSAVGSAELRPPRRRRTLPAADAEELKRETILTTPIDAQPVQCLRLAGPTFITFWAAVFTGGVFIFSTFYLWTAALVSRRARVRHDRGLAVDRHVAHSREG